jgi:hypothetical protein
VFIEALLYCRGGGYGNDQEIRLDEDWDLGIWSQSRAADLLKSIFRNSWAVLDPPHNNIQRAKNIHKISIAEEELC